MSKIPPISDQGLALLRTAASGQRQIMQLLHEQVRSLIARLDAAEERVQELEREREINQLLRCAFCDSKRVRRVGIGYIRCDECGKLGN